MCPDGEHYPPNFLTVTLTNPGTRVPTFELIPVALVLLTLGFAAFVQGFSGFAFGILAMAIISLFAPSPERVSVVTTLGALSAQITLGAIGWRQFGINFKLIALLLCGMVVGIPLGYQFLLHTGQHPQPAFRIAFGCVLLAFAAHGLSRPHIPRKLPALLAPPTGLLSGLITGAFSSGGPPLVLYTYSREKDPRSAKGTLQILLVGSSCIRLASIQSGSGPITLDLLKWAAISVPIVIALCLLGHYSSRRVSIRTFTAGVYALIAVAGILQMIKAFQ